MRSISSMLCAHALIANTRVRDRPIAMSHSSLLRQSVSIRPAFVPAAHPRSSIALILEMTGGLDLDLVCQVEV